MMVTLKRTSILTLFILLSASFGCREVAVPKPKGHFRIDLPKRQYILYNDQTGINGKIPLSFEYPAYGHLTFQEENGSKPGWFNIEFPSYKAKIYLTYKDVKNDLDSLLDQSYHLNVKYHVSKADAINEQVFSNRENKVYGILYDLKGILHQLLSFMLPTALVIT